MPVVRNVDQMNYAEIEKEITSLGQKVNALLWSAAVCICHSHCWLGSYSMLLDVFWNM